MDTVALTESSSGKCRWLYTPPFAHPMMVHLFVFKRLLSLCRGHVHPPELGLPFIDAGIAGTVLAAKLRDQCARPMLLQDANNLFVCETVV